MEKVKQLEKVLMKGLKTPSIIVWITGWLHARQKRITSTEQCISSNWLECKQKDFNSYTAVMLKIVGDILLSHRTELIKIQNKQKVSIKNITDISDKLSNLHPASVQEERMKASLERDIKKEKNSYEAEKEKIKEIEIEINEIEHACFQLIQNTKEKAEALMLIYLQGAKIMPKRMDLLNESISELELYTQYCKCERAEEREGE